MKVILSEIKKNTQGTNSEGKEARVQVNNLEHKEEVNNQHKMKKQEFLKKTRRELEDSGTSPNVPTSKS